MSPGLIERLEKAENGDQDLSLEVNLALEGGEPVAKMANFTMEPCYAIRRPNSNYVGGFENGPNYPVTTSLDAALALAERVLPGDPDFEPTGPSVGWKINLYRGMVPAPLGGWIASLRRHASDGVEGSSSSPALALCIAILKARATQGAK